VNANVCTFVCSSVRVSLYAQLAQTPEKSSQYQSNTSEENVDNNIVYNSESGITKKIEKT